MSDVAPGRLPDWIIIGAMKAATSSLHNWLSLHPRVAVSTPKELNFFIEPNFSDRGLGWYRQQFNDPPDALVAGESSVNYTKNHHYPGVPRRMAEVIPDVKLIYVLRDPLKRIESGYVHNVASGIERASFDDAIRDPESSPIVQTSRYWHQLQDFLEHFPREQIRVMSYDTVERDPAGSLSSALEFIGLDPEFSHPGVGGRLHTSAAKRRPHDLALRITQKQADRNRALRALRRIGSTPIERPVWNPQTRRLIEDYLRPDVEAMREFSGLAFDDWSI
jgi:ribosomal protein S18 acetylase RimI-like enzyme